METNLIVLLVTYIVTFLAVLVPIAVVLIFIYRSDVVKDPLDETEAMAIQFYQVPDLSEWRVKSLHLVEPPLSVYVMMGSPCSCPRCRTKPDCDDTDEASGC